jgi:hypothetical protein
MLHNALVGLVCYSPEVSQWKQIHSRARFALLRAIITWGRGAVSVRKIEGRFKLLIDESKFDGVVDAVEYLLKHLNYYKATRLPDQAREFFGALTALDDFWIEVRSQSVEIRLPRAVLVGATAVKNGDNVTLVGPTKETFTPLDVVLSTIRNVAVASE